MHLAMSDEHIDEPGLPKQREVVKEMERAYRNQCWKEVT